MSLTQTVVNRPTTVGIIFLLVIGFGLYTITGTAIDLYPEIDPPVLLLFSNYPGAGPEEVEQGISRLLESTLSNVGNIEDITSISSLGSSMIVMEFTYGTDMSEATNDVRDKLDFIKGYLPAEATSPQIFKFDPSMIPILMLAVRGDRSAEELKEIAEKIIQPRIEQVEGIALASVSGGRERSVQVEISQNRLEAYSLTLTQIAGILRAQNLQVSAGSIHQGSRNLILNTAGEYRSIEEISDTVISYAGYPVRTVRLKDIANVYDGFKQEESSIVINGKPGVYVTVQKQSGTNSVAAADRVMERIETINDELPHGIEIDTIWDTTTIIRNSLSQVSSTAITGAILAVIMLLLFLRSFKSTLIIGLSIPISIIVTLTIMFFNGLTLNIMTLSGLALGIGMLVDNSIVILENIFRYREKGTKLKSSAIIGSQEMVNAIVASTLTTICVFAPVAVFQSELEMIGEIFADLAFTVVISLLSSLLVALFLVPVLASHYLPIRSNKQQPKTGMAKRIDETLEGFFSRLDNLYKRALSKVVRFKRLTILVVFGIFVGSLFMIPLTGFEFMPQMEEDTISLDVELPLGTRLEETKAVMAQLEMVVSSEVPGAKNVISTSGAGSFMGFLGSVDSYKGSLMITLPEFSERTQSSTEVKEILRKHFNDYPSVTFKFSENEGMGGETHPIDVIVKTNDLERGKDVALRIRDLIKDQIPEVTEPVINLTEGLPQLDIEIDREKAYSLGLNVATIANEIRANIDGTIATKFKEAGNEYDVVVVLDPADRMDIPDLNRIFVVNSFGVKIPVSSFASVHESTGPVSIRRENQTRTIHVNGGLAQQAQLEKVDARVKALIASEIPVDDDIIIEYGGDYADLMKYGLKFIIILIIAVFLVFGVMASQFESFLDPFIIFFTIPLVLIGVIWLYVGTGTNFSIFTAVGLVMLVGIVVNNGIVLVDYTNLLRRRGSSIHDACVEAGGNRLRPILMTTLTTVLGLFPMAFFSGDGAELVQPIGKTVVGGLSVSTVLTLFLVPSIYAVFNEMSDKRKKRREARRQRRLELRRREMMSANGGNRV